LKDDHRKESLLRYYYTCPVTAAWMAKHYRFIYEDLPESTSVIHWQRTNDNITTWVDKGTRIYLTSPSVHQLSFIPHRPLLETLGLWPIASEEHYGINPPEIIPA
jgi:hypothetical protein